MLENIHRVCFVVPALDEAAECTELEKNKHKFGISKLDAPHIFRESAEEVVGPMLQILRQPSVLSGPHARVSFKCPSTNSDMHLRRSIKNLEEAHVFLES